MVTAIIILIYVAFVGFGLQGSLLGAAWPVMRIDFGVEVAFVGVISTVTSVCTMLTTINSHKLVRRFKTGPIVAISIVMTSLSLFGYSTATEWWHMLIWSVPYGIGGGLLDSVLNNYVAINYSSKYMSWLHCFWGIGATISPYIMGVCLTHNNNWGAGYVNVAVIQMIIAVLIFASLPMWKKVAATNAKADVSPSDENQPKKSISLIGILKIRGIWIVLLSFFCYCAVEQTAGFWAATYLVEGRGINSATAAKVASYFYLGIMIGRFISGFVADRLGDKKMIRIGVLVILVGIGLIFVKPEAICLAGLIVCGLGCAPIYPAMVHQTPALFGKENSGAVIGVQMVGAYLGSMAMSPLYGVFSQLISNSFYPVYLGILGVILLLSTEKMGRLKK